MRSAALPHGRGDAVLFGAQDQRKWEREVGFGQEGIAFLGAAHNGEAAVFQIGEGVR